MKVQKKTRAFTVIELMVVLVVIAVIIAALLPAIGRSGRHGGSRQLKDSTQVRGIQQGMVVWANNNKDKYPVPSELDKDPLNPTSEGEGIEKDTTRNIISILIYNQAFSPELCVSPSEVNPDIKIDSGYAYQLPPVKGGDNKAALWDPSFLAYPDDAKASVKPIGRAAGASNTGGFSYAHVSPFGGRTKMWANTFEANQAVIGNRGPTYTLSGENWTLDTTSPRGGVGTPVPSDKSNTLRIHGGRNTWEGNIAYNDNHVNFETAPDPETLLFTFGSGTATKAYHDNLFVAESNGDLRRARQPEDLSTPEGMNGSDNYLRGYVDVTVTDGKASGIKPFFD